MGGTELAGRARTWRDPADVAASEPAALAALVGLVAERRELTRDAARDGARPARPRGRRPGGDRATPRAWRALGTGGRARSRSSPPRSRRTPTSWPSCAEGNFKPIGVIVGHVMRETPRSGGRRGGHAAGPRGASRAEPPTSTAASGAAYDWPSPQPSPEQGGRACRDSSAWTRTGHTELAGWIDRRPRGGRGGGARLSRGARRAATRDGHHRRGHAEQVRELPLDAPLVILRLPIAGG